MPDQIELRQRIILSVNRALLGAITSHLRGVTVDYDKNSFTMRGYFDIGATEDEKEILDAALTEIVADFHSEIEKWTFEAVDKPYPEKMEPLKEWMFLRHE